MSSVLSDAKSPCVPSEYESFPTSFTEGEVATSRAVDAMTALMLRRATRGTTRGDAMPNYQRDIFGGESEILPSARGSQTSLAAALSMMGRPADNARQRVLDCIWLCGPVTDQEIAQMLGMSENTVRPRRLELERDGLLVKAGTRRTQSGREAVKWVAIRRTPRSK